MAGAADSLPASDSVNALADVALLRSEILIDRMKDMGLAQSIMSSDSANALADAALLKSEVLLERLKDLGLTQSTATSDTVNTSEDSVLLRSEALLERLKNLSLTQSENENMLLTQCTEDVSRALDEPCDRQDQLGTSGLRWAWIRQRLLEQTLSVASSSTVSTQMPLGSTDSEGWSQKQLLDITLSSAGGSTLSGSTPLVNTYSENCLSPSLPRSFRWSSICGDTGTYYSDIEKNSQAGGTFSEHEMRAVPNDRSRFSWASVGMSPTLEL